MLRVKDNLQHIINKTNYYNHIQCAYKQYYVTYKQGCKTGAIMKEVPEMVKKQLAPEQASLLAIHTAITNKAITPNEEQYFPANTLPELTEKEKNLKIKIDPKYHIKLWDEDTGTIDTSFTSSTIFNNTPTELVNANEQILGDKKAQYAVNTLYRIHVEKKDLNFVENTEKFASDNALVLEKLTTAHQNTSKNHLYIIRNDNNTSE